MRNRNIIVFSVFHLFFFSCSQKSVEEKSDLGFEKSISLNNGKRLSLSEEINRSSDMIIINDKLVIGDKDDEFYFKEFNILEEKFEGYLGKIGEGPCEIGFPTYLQVVPNNLDDIGLVLKSNFGYQEMSLVPFDKSEQSNCKNGIDKIAFDFMNYVKVADSLFIGTGIFQKKYASFKIGEQSYKELAIDYPYLPAELTHVPNSIPMSQQGKFRIKPDGKALLFTHGSNPFFDILQVDKGGIALKFRWEGEAPDFTGSDSPSGMSAMMTDENIYGFVSSSTTDNFIYLLYSGKKRNHGEEKYSKQVWVYDWNGKPIQKISLDLEVNQIAVSPDDSFLITYHDDGKPNLTRYELGGQ